jgi:hypothetical protein
MHANQIAAEEVAAQMIARCRAGFKDPKHWTNWRKKYDAQIAALPVPRCGMRWLRLGTTPAPRGCPDALQGRLSASLAHDLAWQNSPPS